MACCHIEFQIANKSNLVYDHKVFMCDQSKHASIYLHIELILSHMSISEGIAFEFWIANKCNLVYDHKVFICDQSKTHIFAYELSLPSTIYHASHNSLNVNTIDSNNQP